MKTLLLLTFFLCNLCLFSCSKDKSTPTFGEEVLTSNKFIDGQTYYINGFSFSKASQIKYTLGGAESPDITLNELIDQNGVPFNVYMSSPSNYNAFKLYDTYTSLQDAETAFTAYKIITETIFTDKTGSLAPNTIYTYKSIDGKYAKLLIKGVQKIETSGVAPYYSVSIKWSYQPDGTTSF